MIFVLSSTNIDNWNEIHHNKNTRRRLEDEMMWNWWKRLWGIAYAPSIKSRYWAKQWIQKGRFIGYFPGRKHKKGYNYAGAQKYCNEHYGGLATIQSMKDGILVFSICRDLLAEYWHSKSHLRKRHRGHWKGDNCYIGLQYSGNPKKPFDVWNDRTPVIYKDWSLNEPSFRRKKHCRRIWGSRRLQCNYHKIFDEKCVEMYAYNAGKYKTNKRHKITGKWIYKHRLKQWNNVHCNKHRVGICQKARGQVMHKYIVVRAARTYADAEAFCNHWYGTHLANVKHSKDNIKAMELCRSMDTNPKRSCWIGLQAPYKWWNDKSRADSKYTNWAPGEPNDYQNNEKCVELYAGNGKWNDVSCKVKRFFMCNVQSNVQRMKLDVRDKLVFKRLRRAQQKWEIYKQQALRKKLRKLKREADNKRFWKNAKKQKMVYNRMRQKIRERTFERGMKRAEQGLQSLDAYGKRSASQHQQWMRSNQQERRRRRLLAINKINAINNKNINSNDITKDKQNELSKILKQRYMYDTNDNGYYDELNNRNINDYIDRKCTFFNDISGLYELCVAGDYVIIKRYLYKINKYNNDNNNVTVVEYDDYDNDTYMNYMEYENFKYQMAIKHDNMKDNINYIYRIYDDEETYNLKSTKFIYDFYDNHKEQCWKYLYEFELCLEMNDAEIILKITKKMKLSIVPTQLFYFSNDKYWDEVNTMHLDESVTITKCVHIFESKVCIEYIPSIKDTEMSYTAYVLTSFELEEESIYNL